ncbi:hypothetical protein [Methylocystis sp. S23]
MIDPIERRHIAMRIAALLPPDRESADSIIGLVADLQDWLDAPAQSRPSADHGAAMAPGDLLEMLRAEKEDRP